MKPVLLFRQAGVFTLLLALVTASAAFGQASVATDQPHYAPGDTVLVSGTGWAPGEPVTLTFTADPVGPGPTALSETVDGNGDLSGEFVISAGDGST